MWCGNRNLAVSGGVVCCSADGVIKVWRENKVLLTEIQLAESLNTVCFLNDTADLLVGFKNHIFFIDANKGRETGYDLYF